jgi:hypothetical protein
MSDGERTDEKRKRDKGDFFPSMLDPEDVV